MGQDEQLQYCKVCKNRRFDFEKGILCNLSGEKPEFEETCSNYIEDKAEIEEQKKREKEVQNSAEISGLLAFFIYFVTPVGILVSWVSRLLQWKMMFALGIYGFLFEIAFLLFYTYFESYVIYGFIKRKSDVVFIAKYQLIVLVVVNIGTVLLGATNEDSFLDNTPRIITSIVWSLIYFLYLCFSDNVKDLIPKEIRKLQGRNKMLVILSLIIPTILYIMALFDTTEKTYGATALSAPQKQLEAICNASNAELPKEVSDGLIWTRIYVDGTSLVFKYQYNDELSQQFYEIPEISSFYALYQKELLKSGLSDMTEDDDPSFKVCSKLGYDIKYVYTTSDGNTVSTISLTKPEYSEILSRDYHYTLSDTNFNAIVTSYNELMPIEYFEGCYLNRCDISDSDGCLHYSLELYDLDMSTLSSLTSKYLKEYMLNLFPYLTDAPHTLAVLTERDIVF